MKTLIIIQLFLLYINIHSATCQMLIKEIITYKDIGDTVKPAIMELHHTRNLSVIRIDGLSMTEGTGLFSKMTYDIFEYYLTPGFHTVEANMTYSDTYYYHRLYTGGPLYIKFNAEAGKRYILDYKLAIFYNTSEWNLLIKDKVNNEIITSYIDTRLKEILSIIKDSGNVQSRINAVYELKSLNGYENVFNAKYNTKDKKALKVLLVLLDDNDVDVRINTISALTEIENDTAVTALQKLYKNSVDDEKIILNSALIVFNEENYDTLLIRKGLNSNNYKVRTVTAYATGKLRDKSMVEPLLELLNDKYYQVRLKAIWSLGELGDKKAIPNLKLLKTDKNIKIRNEAKKAIKKLKNKE